MNEAPNTLGGVTVGRQLGGAFGTASGGTVALTPADQRPPEVDLTLGALGEQVARMESVIQELESRLPPVMRQLGPLPESSDDRRQPLTDDLSAPLAQRLASFTHHLDVLSDRGVALLDRLQI